jgi:hypothetical protein
LAGPTARSAEAAVTLWNALSMVITEYPRTEDEALARPVVVEHPPSCPNFPRDVIWQVLAERLIGSLQVLTVQVDDAIGRVSEQIDESVTATMRNIKAIVADVYDEVFEVEAGICPRWTAPLSPMNALTR